MSGGKISKDSVSDFMASPGKDEDAASTIFVNDFLAK